MRTKKNYGSQFSKMVPPKKKKNKVYNKCLDSEVTGLLSQIPQFLKLTQKPLSQEATDCLDTLEYHCRIQSLFSLLQVVETFVYMDGDVLTYEMLSGISTVGRGLKEGRRGGPYVEVCRW